MLTVVLVLLNMSAMLFSVSLLLPVKMSPTWCPLLSVTCSSSTPKDLTVILRWFAVLFAVSSFLLIFMQDIVAESLFLLISFLLTE